LILKINLLTSPERGNKMKTKILLLVLILVLGFSEVFSQGTVIRYLNYNGPGNAIDEVTGIAMEPIGSVYVTGFSKGSNSDEDFATIKFNNNGDFLWVSRFNGTGNNKDRAEDIVIDQVGNVYVTGWGYMEPEALCGTIDFITIKYNTFGEEMWVKRYNGTGNGEDKAIQIALDAAGNVYVAGTSYGGNNKQDYAVVKYNNNGVQQWVARYDGVSHDADFLNAMTLDRFGNVFVTGSSYKSGQYADYVTLKYNSSGVLQWNARYNGPVNQDDKAFAIETDVHGSCFVTGASKGSGSNYDYATIKYDASGLQLWAKRYNGPGNNIDQANAMVLDPYGFCYVTGSSKGNGTNYDYATIRYDALGNEVWVKRYNTQNNGNDEALDIGIFKKLCPVNYDYPCWNFELFITGKSQGSSSGYDFLTLKYNELGDLKWSCRYSSSGSVEDVANVVVVRDELPYIWVAGRINNNYGITQISNRSSSFDNNNTVSTAPVTFKISQNYPNPFNPVTVISYDIPKDVFVELKVFDILGKEITTLVNEFQVSGTYNVNFDASNLPSGTYIYTIKAGENAESKKMVLMK
jgi:uncharacterized delta-60 repeat protein